MSIRKRDNFGPSCEAVNDSEQVGHALAFRERPNQVNMKTTEPIRWGYAFCELGASMAVNFGGLTVRALFASLSDVTPHAMPLKALRDCLLCGYNTRVRKFVVLVKYLTRWVALAWISHGSVTKEFCCADIDVFEYQTCVSYSI